MRRRTRRRVVEIPPEIMDEQGNYERSDTAWGEPRVPDPWAIWCEQTGYSKISFLRESIRRRLTAYAVEDPTGPWRAFHPDPWFHRPHSGAEYDPE